MTRRPRHHGLILLRRRVSRSSSRLRRRRMRTLRQRTASTMSLGRTRRYFKMMCSFNESSENSHLPSEIEGSRRLRGQATQKRTLRIQTTKRKEARSLHLSLVRLRRLATRRPRHQRKSWTQMLLECFSKAKKIRTRWGNRLSQKVRSRQKAQSRSGARRSRPVSQHSPNSRAHKRSFLEAQS